MKNSYSPLVRLGRYCLAAVLLLAGFGTRAQAPGWNRLVLPTATSTTSAGIVASVADASGNVYILGHCAGSTTFGSTTFTFSASGADTYVAKWNPTAGFVWAIRGGGGSGASDADNAYITPIGLAIQGNSLYLAGTFDGPTAAFGSTILQNGGQSLMTRNSFVAKITDAGTSASFAWAQRLSFASLQGSGFSLAALAASGSSLYVTGFFQGATFSVGGIALTNAGIADIYLAKLTDAGSSASVVWAQRAGGNFNDQASALAVRGSSVYLTGFTNSASASFGSVSVPAIGSFVKNVFVARLNDAGTTGSFVWATRAGSANTSDVSGAQLALSGGSVYVAGLYSGDATLGASSLPTVSSSDYNVYVGKLSDAGSSGVFVWGQAAGSTGIDYAEGLAANGTGVYLTGHFTGPTATFGTTALPNANSSAVYLAKLTDAGATGAFAWAQQGGASTTAPTSLRSLAAGVLLGPGQGYVLGNLAGSYTGGTPPSSTTATFGSISLTTPGSYIPFIATFLDNGLLATAPAAARPAPSLWPNPAHGTATVRRSAGADYHFLTLTDALGRELRRYPAALAPETTLDLHGLPAGVYLLHAGPSAQRLTVE